MLKKTDLSWAKTSNNTEIHKKLFEDSGIVVVKSMQMTPDKSDNYTTDNSFRFESREMVLESQDEYILQVQDLESLAKVGIKPKKTLIIDASSGLFEFNEHGNIKKIFDLTTLKKHLNHLNLEHLLTDNLQEKESIEKTLSYKQLTKLNELISSKGGHKLQINGYPLKIIASTNATSDALILESLNLKNTIVIIPSLGLFQFDSSGPCNRILNAETVAKVFNMLDLGYLLKGGYSLEIISSKTDHSSTDILKNLNLTNTNVIIPSLGLFQFDSCGPCNRIFDSETLTRVLKELELEYLLEPLKKDVLMKKNISYEQLTKLNEKICSSRGQPFKQPHSEMKNIKIEYLFKKKNDYIENELSYVQLTTLNKLIVSKGGHPINLPKPDNKNLNLQRELIRRLTNQNPNTDTPVLFNWLRREEVFFPVTLEQTFKKKRENKVELEFEYKIKQEIEYQSQQKIEYKKKKFGGFHYVWATDNKKTLPQELKFDQFHTVGCLKGSALKGINQNDRRVCLIKHELEFSVGEIIDTIVCNKDLSDYDKILFTEFKNTAAMIAAYSSSDTRQLLYHLPSYDYIIFIGIELFIRGRITLVAFSDLCSIILNIKNEHIQKITEICNKFNINVTFSSPFDNILKPLDIFYESIKHVPKQSADLNAKPCAQSVTENIESDDLSFDDFPYEDIDSEDEESENKRELLLAVEQPSDMQKDSRTCLGKEVLNILGLSCVELPVPLNDKTDKMEIVKKQKELVANILDKLISNQYDITQQKVWRDFKQCSQIDTLEKLVQTANAVMIAIAAKDREDFKTCSILPTSEKQIAVSYMAAKLPQYPAVFIITTVDPVVAYQPKNNGNPFYAADTDLAEVFEAKLIQQGHKNIILFSNGAKPTPLEQCLNNKMDDDQIRALRNS